MMKLSEYNNKHVTVHDIDGKAWTGLALYEDKDTYEQPEDGLSIKTTSGWVGLLESEIKSVEII